MNYIKKFGGISTTLFLLSTLAVLFGTADIFNINYVFAGNSCTSSGSGDWDNAVTWTRCGGAIPQSDDDVVIQNGHTVTITDTTAYTINSLTIQSTGALTHSVQTDTAAPWVKSAVIDITAGTFTISGTVNLDEKGYNENTNFAGDGYGPGLGLGSNLVDDGAGGGAHAGDGGDGYDSGVAVKSGGSSYDSALSPVEPGSSGGTLRSKKGGAGGGVVKFTVTGGGTFTLDGTITADGGHGEATNTGAHGSGAGAGGSIWLDFNDEGGTLAGSGSITATGGVGGCDSDVHPSCGGFESGGGGGGGGFITILDWSTDSSSYTIDVSGGDGGAGAQSGSDGGDGTLTMNGLPTATSFSPAQTSASAVTFTTTVSDPDSDATSLVIEHSTDNSTWTSSTLGNITFSEEDENTFSSSTGNITSIDTNVDGSVTLTIEWNIGADIPDTDDNDVWLRVVPSDNSGNGSTVTSASFVVDNLAPTAPGSLGVSSTSTTGVVLSFGSVTSESNFAEYKIFYKQGAGDVTTSDTEFSSSTDANLGVINFNGASNATITELATSTKYTFNIWAYDIYDQSTSSTSELTFYTLADQPGTLVASDPAISTIDLTLDGGTNPSSVEYALYESTTGNYVATDNGLDSASPIWKTSSSWSDPTVTGLSTSTIHTFSIIARNGDNFETATTTASALYTLAETADAPTISSPTATTLPITLNVGGNSAGTAYALYNTTDGNYLAADGSDGGSTSVYQATSTWGADFAAIGLTPNTSYQFTATSRNGDGVDAATSTASTATSTLPASPSTPTATVGGQTSITVAWAANDNPAATVYEMYNITNSSIVATTTDLSLVVSGLTAGTSYTFKVRAESSFDSGLYSAYSGSSSAVTTESAPSAEDNPNNSPARFGYLSLLPPEAPADGSPEFLINNGAIDTSEVDVVLSLNSPQAHTMAVSNYSDFVGISLEPYNSSRHWRLLPGSGEKTVYLKLRTAEGGQKVISESINLIDPYLTEDCPLELGGVYKSKNSNAVYYITSANNVDGSLDKDTPCTKRAFTSSQKYFTYFKSWDEVGVVEDLTLSSIPENSLGFMPAGPFYDPQYGALVKVVADSKVYLLLNDKKYWITDESIFDQLNYRWDWIEDVSPLLLAKYSPAGEINYTDRHPNFTLAKYENDSRVYRIEPDPKDNTRQIKRLVPNEYTFSALNFRWDRIVTISNSEVYEDGGKLVVVGEVKGEKIVKGEDGSNTYQFTSFLDQGSSGEEILQLQLKLQRLGYFPSFIDTTGYYGPVTRKAVVNFQNQNNIDPLGFVGPATRASLNSLQ